MTPEQVHAWQVLNDALELLVAAAEDARRVAELTQQRADADSRRAELSTLLSVATTAASASAKGRDTLRPLVEAALAVGLPPDLAGSAQVVRVRELLGLVAP